MENTEHLPMDGDRKAGCGNGTWGYRKNHGHAMKGLQKKIKDQMEFYFAKINKYRFIKQQLDNAPDGYIPLSLFLNFPKLLKLTRSAEVIAKALERSNKLEISKDKTKVRRIQPVHYLSEEEADKKTVYVEGLPSTADHNWIAQCFSSCGKVMYVSLPRYGTAGDIKGFAFVEFETPVEAAKAIEKMNMSGLPCDERQEVGALGSTTEHKRSDENMKKEQNAKKKKLKVKEATTKSSEQPAFKEADSRKGKRKSTDRTEADCAKKSKSDSSDKMEEMKTKDGETTRKKNEPPRLRVMSKHEWSRLRRQYLDQQRASMAKCSNVAQGTKHSMVSAHAREQKSVLCLRSAPKFQPNVIVEIKSENPMSHKQLKQQIQSDIKVAYIDVKDNMLHGYIRCKDADSAQKLVASSLTGCMLHLVQGKKERKYWNKMQLDRMSKWANSRRPKKKGSSKILEKVKNFMLQSVEKSHIFFEEDGSERQAERHDEENGLKAQASMLRQKNSKMNHTPKSEGELNKVANIKPSKNVKHCKKQALKEDIDPEKKEQGDNSMHATSYKDSKTNAEKEQKSKKKQKHWTGTENSEQPVKKVKRCNGENSENSELSGLLCDERQEVGASGSTTEHKRSDKKMKKEQNAKKEKLKVKEVTTKSSEQPAVKEADSRKGKRKSTDRTEAECGKKSKSDASDKIKEMNAKDEKMTRKKNEPTSLKVMSKHEKSRPKPQYLDQQGASIASCKQPLHSICSNVAQGTKCPRVSANAGDQKPVSCLRSAPKFQPNVVVEIKSEDPMSHKQLKQRIQSDIKVAYIDVKDNMLRGYIRCKDADSAQKLVASSLTGCMLHLLQGKKERKYWNKMQLDRMGKWANSERSKRKGSSKILEKVKNFMLQSVENSHIFFEEDGSQRQAERHEEKLSQSSSFNIMTEKFHTFVTEVLLPSCISSNLFYK